MKLTKELQQLLSCPICGESFVQVGPNEHIFKPRCKCIKQTFRISVG